MKLHETLSQKIADQKIIQSECLRVNAELSSAMIRDTSGGKLRTRAEATGESTYGTCGRIYRLYASNQK